MPQQTIKKILRKRFGSYTKTNLHLCDLHAFTNNKLLHKIPNKKRASIN